MEVLNIKNTYKYVTKGNYLDNKLTKQQLEECSQLHYPLSLCLINDSNYSLHLLSYIKSLSLTDCFEITNNLDMIHQITTLKSLRISNFYNKHIEFNFENESLNYLYVDNTILHP